MTSRYNVEAIELINYITSKAYEQFNRLNNFLFVKYFALFTSCYMFVASVSSKSITHAISAVMFFAVFLVVAYNIKVIRNKLSSFKYDRAAKAISYASLREIGDYKPLDKAFVKEPDKTINESSLKDVKSIAESCRDINDLYQKCLHKGMMTNYDYANLLIIKLRLSAGKDVF